MYWLGALNQKIYPGARDVDDCWVVATIWACRYQTHQQGNLPTVPEFRVAAGNPDDPFRPDGGNHFQIDRASDTLWPTVKNLHFASRDWATFTAYLKRGGSASVATKSSLLPSILRFGFYGPHQISVVHRDGHFKAMNPLAPKGSPLITISEADLKRAVLGLNGWVLAVIFPKMDRATVKKTPLRGGLPRPFYRWERKPSGLWVRTRDFTRGFTEACTPAKRLNVQGEERRMVLITTGSRAGYHINVEAAGTTYTP